MGCVYLVWVGHLELLVQKCLVEPLINVFVSGHGAGFLYSFQTLESYCRAALPTGDHHDDTATENSR